LAEIGRRKSPDRLLRLEDDKLLRGAGRFVDDLSLPGMLHASFVRSQVAHAHLRGVDVEKARQAPGVRAVYTWADLRPHLTVDRLPAATPAAAIKVHLDPVILADKEVHYVGEPVAMIIAESRALAEDAAALVMLDLEPLPAVVDIELGLSPRSPKARLDCTDNTLANWRIGYGDIDAAFDGADHRIAMRYDLHKGGAHSMETRGLVAHYDTFERQLKVWDSTQMPHRVKRVLVACLGLDETRVRVIAPDVGGGFGPKGPVYAEEVAVPLAAVLMGAPIKWIEDRYEHFVTTNQERDQIWEVEAAFDAGGRLRGIRGALKHDHGACTPSGIQLPQNSTTNLIGPYHLPAYRIDVSLCLTNKVPSTSTRGAGRPQGTFVMERLLDRIAATLDLPREEVRSRNLIPPERLPYITQVVTRDGLPMTYDTGDYPGCQERALTAAGWSDFAARQQHMRVQGRYIGIGLANYLEGTGRGPFESAEVRIGASGKLVVTSGAASQGQGTATMLATIAAGVFDMEPNEVEVVHGDTGAAPMGLGAYASRQTVTAGSATLEAARRVRQKALEAASVILDTPIDELEVAGGRVRRKGPSNVSKSLADIARALGGVAGFSLPKGITPGLSALVDFEPPAITYTNGAHVAEVEVDPMTGVVTINRYIVVHDCGRIVNPELVDGQVIGGVIHGIGATLFEHMRFAPDGQPLTVNFADYLLPTADVAPRIEIHHMESPTPLNPLGAKGAAESGTIGAPAAIVSAIENALSPFGVEIARTPVTPAALATMIYAARAKGRR
jgi:carbon-monoxide dehydrogenase large subunit